MSAPASPLIGKHVRIPLSRGLSAIVDHDDEAGLASIKWHAVKCGSVFYAARSSRYGGSKKMILMHRQIMGFPEGAEVDHINGDKLDNRRCNLRLASPSENKCNCGRRSNNTSGFKGVRWHSQRRKWCAEIQKDKKRRHLGLFETKAQAYEAYCAAAANLHQEFSRVA